MPSSIVSSPCAMPLYSKPTRPLTAAIPKPSVSPLSAPLASAPEVSFGQALRTGFSDTWPGTKSLRHQVLTRLKGILQRPLIQQPTMRFMDTRDNKAIPIQNSGTYCNGLLRRGSAPTVRDLRVLRDEGVRVIIDLRQLAPNALNERKMACKALGLKYNQVPLYPHQPPSAEQIRQLLEILEAAKSQAEPVFIHCKYGKDRTSMVFALAQRLVYDEPSPDEMKKVARYHNFKPHEYTATARWIENLPTTADIVALNQYF
jgi:protein-tyrosine phosphatase